jgi:hypothetical protein
MSDDQQKFGSPEELHSTAVDVAFDRFHNFWLIATPKIFEWFEWVAVLGALTFLYNKHPAAALVPLLVLGYLSLVFYFGAFFLKYRVTIPGVHSKALQDILSGFLAIALGFGANRLVQLAVSAFSVGAP